jgi:hypothetical protein
MTGAETIEDKRVELGKLATEETSEDRIEEATEEPGIEETNTLLWNALQAVIRSLQLIKGK